MIIIVEKNFGNHSHEVAEQKYPWVKPMDNRTKAF